MESRAPRCGLVLVLAAVGLTLPLRAQTSDGRSAAESKAPATVSVAVPSPLSPVVKRDLTLRLAMELQRPTWAVDPLYAPSFRLPRLVYRRELFAVGGLSLTTEYEYAETALERSACYSPRCEETEHMRAALALDYHLATWRLPALREAWEFGLGAEVGTRTTDVGPEYSFFIGPRIRATRDDGSRGRAPKRPDAATVPPGSSPRAGPARRPLVGLGVHF